MIECSETKNESTLEKVSAMLSQYSSKQLKSLLLAIPGAKFLIVDPELIVCLDYIIKITDLKNCGIEKIFRLNCDDPPPQVDGCIYFVKSTIENAIIVANQITADARPEKIYYVVFVPKKTYACDEILEREGVYEYVRILEYSMGFITIDSDLLSLELQDFYPTFFLYNDQSHFHMIAKSLVQLQTICGTIPVVQGHGKATEKIYEVMVSMFQEDMPKYESQFISHLFVFDRDIDYLSILLTQLNCEGLLDETFEIKTGRLTVEKEISGLDQDIKLNLNDSDMIFRQIRNVHISQVFNKLKEITNQLKLHENLKTNLTISSMKQIVAHKIKTAAQENLLPVYMNTCGYIVNERQKRNFGKQLNIEGSLLYQCSIEGYSLKDVISFIENAMCKQDSMYTILRLMCLLSITHDGIPVIHYKNLCEAFMKSYGHKHLITFHNLKKLGICIEQPPFYHSLTTLVSGGSAGRLAEKVVAAVTSLPKHSAFTTIVKKMSLVSKDNSGINLKTPVNMSYVFNGAYIPLIGQLTEKLLDHKFDSVQEVLKLLPGKTIDTTFSISELQPNVSHKPWSITPSDKVYAHGEVNKIVIIFVLGGITYAEIAALRLLSQAKGLSLIVATTSIINGNTLMKIACP